jgi:hypothetical protein
MSQLDGGAAFPIDCKVNTWYIPLNQEDNHAMQMVFRKSVQKAGKDLALQKALPVPTNACQCQAAQQISSFLQLVRDHVEIFAGSLPSLRQET